MQKRALAEKGWWMQEIAHITWEGEWGGGGGWSRGGGCGCGYKGWRQNFFLMTGKGDGESPPKGKHFQERKGVREACLSLGRALWRSTS